MERHRINYTRGAVEIDGVPYIRCGKEGMSILRFVGGEFVCIVKFVSLGMTFYAAVRSDLNLYIRRSPLSVSRLVGGKINLLLKELKS